jgi:hypothetical protein
MCINICTHIYVGGIVSAAVDGMKVGRSVINIINKQYKIKTPINKQLEELSNSIENITANLKEESVDVNEIVSYQAEMVFKKEKKSEIPKQIENKSVDIDISDVDVNDSEEKILVKKPRKSLLFKKILKKNI